MNSQWDFPSGSLPFLQAIRENIRDRLRVLIFTDWLEEQGKLELAGIFRTYHRASEDVAYTDLVRLTGAKKDKKYLSTLVALGEEKAGQWVLSIQSRAWWYHAYTAVYKAVRANTKGARWLVWKEDKRKRSQRGNFSVNSMLLLEARPCSFADMILANPNLNGRKARKQKEKT